MVLELLIFLAVCWVLCDLFIGATALKVTEDHSTKLTQEKKANGQSSISYQDEKELWTVSNHRVLSEKESQEIRESPTVTASDQKQPTNQHSIVEANENNQADNNPDLHSRESVSESCASSISPADKKISSIELDSDALTSHELETNKAQKLLKTVFADNKTSGELRPTWSMELDDPHNSLFAQLVTKETWDRVEVLKISEALNLMLEGAIETVNDWAYENVEARLIHNGETLYVDPEVAQKLIDANAT